MASITDCVVEGLKYPFNDIKKLLSFGAIFALISVLSTYIGFKSMDAFRVSIHVLEKTNTTMSNINISQLPTGDFSVIAGLSIVCFIISLFIMGYEYNIVKFSINKKEDLPGFTNLFEMFVNGVKYFIVTLAYNLIPALVLIAGVILIGESSVLPIFVLISMLMFIIAYFLLIMALNNMIAHDSIGKAFDLREITDNISNLGWGKYIGIILFTIIVMAIISVAVGFVLSFLTVGFAALINNQAFVVSVVIAIIEGLFIDSYMSIFFNRVCGSVYREAIK